MAYIIRDHDRKKFEQKKQLITQAVDFINRKYGDEIIDIKIDDQYYNMREQVEKQPEIMDFAIQAVKAVGFMENMSLSPHSPWKKLLKHWLESLNSWRKHNISIFGPSLMIPI